MAETKEGKKVPLTIRIPEELRRKLARMAKQRGTSLNAQILQGLETWVERPLMEELRELIEELRKK